MMDYVWLIPLFPLIGFLINGLVGKSLPKTVVGTIGSAAVGLSFLVTVAIFLEFLKLPEGTHAVEKVVYTWIASGTFKASVAFLIDPLSLIMLLVVSGVSTLIHIYSIGYMHDDEGFYRYFSYLNLFVFAMLILVSANNFLLMFVGWEGVGLCSYLLIGFWYEKQSASDAGKKAFVVNRIGDFGFLLGHLPDLLDLRVGELHGSLPPGRQVPDGVRGPHRHHPVPVFRGHRQIGPDTPVHLAA